MFDPNVEYRPIPDFEGYLAGSDGSIWSCRKKGRRNEDSINGSWHKLSARTSRLDGYITVVICGENDRRRNVGVHTLILESFVGPPPEPGMVARHFPDSNKHNCAISNLRWGTYKQNCDDRDFHGRTAVGVRNSNAKITDDDVREIRSLNYRGCVAAMERKFGLSRATVIAIRKRRTWKHVV